MSADNFIEVDHDGDQFIVRHGFMSCEYDDEYPVPEVGRFDTDEEVCEFIEREYYIIEYGVSYTPAARIACCGPIENEYEKIEELKAQIKRIQATLDTSCETSEEWMEEALAGRDTIQRLKNELRAVEALIAELQKTIEALQGRERDYIRRMNEAIFLLEDQPPLDIVDDVFGKVEE